MMHVVDLDPDIERYKTFVFAHTILRYLLLFFTVSIFLFPCALIIRYILIGLDHSVSRYLRRGKLFINLIYAVSVVGIISLASHFGKQQNDAFAAFIVISVCLSVYFVHRFLKPIKNAIKNSLSMENSGFLPLCEDYRISHIIVSLFKGSHFIQPSLGYRVISIFFMFISNFIIFIYAMLVISLIIAPITGFHSYPNELDIGVNQQLTDTQYYEVVFYFIGKFVSYFCILLIFSFPLSLLAKMFRTFGDVLNRKNIYEYRKLDPRKPILLLRSFEHKQIKLNRSTFPMSYRFLMGDHLLKNLDNLLEKAFWNVGPVYSLAAPQQNWEKVSGSLKQEFEDEVWFEEIKKLIVDSLVVVVSPGKTRSVEREIDHLKKTNNLNNTLFVFSGKNTCDQDYLEILPILNQLTEKSRSELCTNKVRAIYYNNGKPVVLKSSNGDPHVYIYIISYFLKIKHMISVCSQKEISRRRQTIYWGAATLALFLFLNFLGSLGDNAGTANIPSVKSSDVFNEDAQKTRDNVLLTFEITKNDALEKSQTGGDAKIYYENVTMEMEVVKNFLKDIFDGEKKLVAAYQKELEALGWFRVASFNNLNNSMLEDGIRISKKAKIVIQKYQVHSSNFQRNSLSLAEDLPIRPSTRSTIKAGLISGIEKSKARTIEFWQLEHKVLDTYNEMFNFLYSKNKDWIFQEGQIFFGNDNDVDLFNEHWDKIEQYVTRQQEIAQEGIKSANRSLELMRELN